eukprot:m.153385 g.153385  ORF g.153385 m.153385 type:complete len:355 (-) comp17471_c1_seq2:710-1774(-)
MSLSPIPFLLLAAGLAFIGAAIAQQRVHASGGLAWMQDRAFLDLVAQRQHQLLGGEPADAHTPASPNTNLKYFGFYDDRPLTDTASFSNIHQASHATDAVEAKALGQNSLLSLYSTLWVSGSSGLTLRADYQTRLAALEPLAKQLLNNGTIFGFNLGDELAWNCLQPADLKTGANAVRAMFPRGTAVIWYNEASMLGPKKNSCGKVVSDYSIPAALDWFSIDMYHMDGVVAGWVDKYVKTYYETYIFSNITANQTVMLVPGSFGSHVNHYPNGTYICDQHCYDVMCANDAHDFYAWASTDSRVSAICPWNWAGCPACNGSRWTPPHTCCMDEIGTVGQPLATVAWTAIGKEIIA